MIYEPVPYLGSVGWYRARWRGSPVVPPALNRAYIRGTHGVQALSVPIRGSRRTLSRLPWSELRVSEHDDWRHKHWQALQSAYGSLPYFQYVKDSFEPLYLSGPIEKLCDFSRALDAALQHCARLEEAARWLSGHPEYVPPGYEGASPVPDDISAFELLCVRGPSMVFDLMKGGEA